MASKVRKVSSEKRGSTEDRLPKTAAKLAPRCGARAIWKSKSFKTGMPGAPLENKLRKICTTLWRESDLEVKIVKKLTILGRFWKFKMYFPWQVQGFRHVAKHAAGARIREGCKNVGKRGGFKEGLKRCVSRGRRRDFVLCDVDV